MRWRTVLRKKYLAKSAFKTHMVWPYNHLSFAMFAMRNEFTRIKQNISETARLASRKYRITWNLLSKTITTITNKFPGTPITLKSAWNNAMTLVRTMLEQISFLAEIFAVYDHISFVKCREAVILIAAACVSIFRVLWPKEMAFFQFYHLLWTT